MLVIVDGGWGRWKALTRCSTTCGVGTHIMTRTCSSPAPSNNGNQCVGVSENIRKCYAKQCLGEDSYASLSWIVRANLFIDDIPHMTVR